MFLFFGNVWGKVSSTFVKVPAKFVKPRMNKDLVDADAFGRIFDEHLGEQVFEFGAAVLPLG